MMAAQAMQTGTDRPRLAGGPRSPPAVQIVVSQWTPDRARGDREPSWANTARDPHSYGVRVRVPVFGWLDVRSRSCMPKCQVSGARSARITASGP